MYVDSAGISRMVVGEDGEHRCQSEGLGESLLPDPPVNTLFLRLVGPRCLAHCRKAACVNWEETHTSLRVAAQLGAHTCHSVYRRGADRTRGLGSVTQGEKARLPELSCRESLLKTGGPHETKAASSSCSEQKSTSKTLGRARGYRYLEVKGGARM